MGDFEALLKEHNERREDGGRDGSRSRGDGSGT